MADVPVRHRRLRHACSGLLLVAILAGGERGARADDADANGGDKSRYTIIDPVPDAKLRAFNPDRPGQSHDPTTIDAGHVEVEIGGFEHVFDPRGPSAVTTRRYTYADTLVRVGVTNWMEIQLATPLSNLSRLSGSETSRAAGIGDTMVGAKINLIGNDGGDHILALLPILKVPTAARGVGNDHVEFLLSVPYNYALRKDLALTLEPSVGVVRNQDNTRYQDSLGFIAGLDQTIGPIVASIEISTIASTERKNATQWAYTPSIAYILVKNVQLDAGITFGLNKATARYNPSAGITVRF